MTGKDLYACMIVFLLAIGLIIGDGSSVSRTVFPITMIIDLCTGYLGEVIKDTFKDKYKLRKSIKGKSPE